MIRATVPTSSRSVYARVLNAAVLLRQHPNQLIRLIGVIDRFDALIPPYRDGENHPGEQNRIPQRQDRQFLRDLYIVQPIIIGFIQRYDGHEIQIIFGTHE